MTWRERIVAARERGSFTFEEVMLAGDWTACAVGEQHTALPGVVMYSLCSEGKDACRCRGPLDGILHKLGGGEDDAFLNCVRKGDISGAESLLDQIEDRVLELKRNV